MNSHEILKQVALNHDVLVSDIKSPKRHYKLVGARIEAARIIRESRGLSRGQIGIILNRSEWMIDYYLKPVMRSSRQFKMRRKHQWKSMAAK